MVVKLLLAILFYKQDVVNGWRRSPTSLHPLNILIPCAITILLRACSTNPLILLWSALYISSWLNDPMIRIEMGQRHKLRARTGHSLNPLRPFLRLFHWISQWVHYVTLVSIFGKEIVLLAGCISDWKPDTLVLSHRVLQSSQPNIFAFRHMFLFDKDARVCVLLLASAIPYKFDSFGRFFLKFNASLVHFELNAVYFRICVIWGCLLRCRGDGAHGEEFAQAEFKIVPSGGLPGDSGRCFGRFKGCPRCTPTVCCPIFRGKHASTQPLMPIQKAPGKLRSPISIIMSIIKSMYILILNLYLRDQRVIIVLESLLPFLIFVFPWIRLHNFHVCLELLRALLSTACLSCQLLLPDGPRSCAFGVFICIDFFVNYLLAFSMVFYRGGLSRLEGTGVASIDSIISHRLESLVLIYLALTWWAIFQAMPVHIIIMLL